MNTYRPTLVRFLVFELRRVLRSPGILVWTLAFPVVFYLVNFANKTNNPGSWPPGCCFSARPPPGITVPTSSVPSDDGQRARRGTRSEQPPPCRQADGWRAARSMAVAAVRARADTAARQYAVADMALEAAACWVRMTRAWVA
jgi:hypothetical protein